MAQAKENKNALYFGWTVIICFLVWATWITYNCYNIYSFQYNIGAKSGDYFWEQHRTERGHVLGKSIQDFMDANTPKAKKYPFTLDGKGIRTVVFEMQPLREWSKVEGWKSGFHSVLDLKPK